MSDWQKVKMGELFDQYRIQHLVQDNRDYGQITISKNGYVKYRTTKNGKLIGRKRQFLIDLVTHPNTLLFTRQGVAEGAIGFAPNDVDGCIATENMPMFSLKPNMSKSFIQLLLKSANFKNGITRFTPTGSAQKSIHERDLMTVELQIPSFKVQNILSFKIESQLNKIKKVSTQITHQQTLLKKLRQAILQEAIEGKLTKQRRKENTNVEPASVLLKKIKAEKARLVAEKKIKKAKPLPPIEKDEIPFEIPESWEWCHIEHIIDNKKYSLKAGPFGSSLTKAMYTKSGYKIYGQEQVIKQNPYYGHYYINLDKYNELLSCSVEPYDILLSLVGTIGKLLILPNDIESGIINPRLIKIRLHKTIDKKYFSFLYKSLLVQTQLKSNVSGQTMAVVTMKILKKIYLPLPPLSEQKEIVKKVDNLFAMFDELEGQINDSKANADMLMQAVLKEAFSH